MFLKPSVEKTKKRKLPVAKVLDPGNTMKLARLFEQVQSKAAVQSESESEAVASADVVIQREGVPHPPPEPMVVEQPFFAPKIAMRRRLVKTKASMEAFSKLVDERDERKVVQYEGLQILQSHEDKKKGRWVARWLTKSVVESEKKQAIKIKVMKANLARLEQEAVQRERERGKKDLSSCAEIAASKTAQFEKTILSVLKGSVVKKHAPVRIQEGSKVVFHHHSMNVYRKEIHMYGRLETGQSVCARVREMHPYFYFRVPVLLSKEDRVKFETVFLAQGVAWCKSRVEKKREAFRNKQSGEMQYKFSEVKDDVILKMDIEHGASLYGYEAESVAYYRVEVTQQCHIASLMELLENPHGTREESEEVVVPSWLPPFLHPVKYPGWKEAMGGSWFDCSEGNVAMDLRMMMDKGIKGTGWVECRGIETCKRRVTSCDMEFMVHVNCVSAVTSKTFVDMVLPRICSIDLECRPGKAGAFPVAEYDPILQIGCRVFEGTRQVNYIFMLGSVRHVFEEDHVFCYMNEWDMLLDFIKFVQQYDLDWFIGWNTNNFDWPYIHGRWCALSNPKGLQLGPKEWRKWPEGPPLRMNQFRVGRLVDEESKIVVSKFKTAAHVSEEKKATMTGRLNLDLMQYAQKQFKWDSYKLESVAQRELGEGKEEIAYSEIPNMMKTEAGRIELYVTPFSLLNQN